MGRQVKSKNLEKKIAARQKFIEEVIGFVNQLVSEEGVMLTYEEYSCHTYTLAELNNLACFSFRTSGSFTMFGGDQVMVWYHPGSEKSGLDPVFDVTYWDIKECEVKYFDPSEFWQQALRRLIRNKKRLLARRKRLQEQKLEHEKNLNQNKEIDTELRKEAERLKIDKKRYTG